MSAAKGFIIGGCIFLAFGIICAIPSIRNLTRLRSIVKRLLIFRYRMMFIPIDDVVAERKMNNMWCFLVVGFLFGFPMLMIGIALIGK